MPAIDTARLTIELPDDWETFVEDGRLVAQGPRQEEIIVSRARLDGEDSDGQGWNVLKECLTAAMRKTVANPELTILENVTESTVESGLLILRLASQSTDGEIRFDQFGLMVDDEATLLTFEAPSKEIQSLRRIEQAIANASIRQEQD